MLNTLSIHNFALVQAMELEFGSGMTVITGETGAGKSILLDALGLTLGQRAEADFVRRGADKADISATFHSNTSAAEWLQEHDLPADEDIILRRVVSAEGRSRGYINGRPVSAADLREIASRLISVHSQNAHQRLLEKDAPRDIIDAFAGLQNQATELRNLWSGWQSAQRKLNSLQENTRVAVKRRADIGFVSSAPDKIGLGALAECEPQCIQQNGFTGTGVTGDYRHAGTEFQLHRLH